MKILVNEAFKYGGDRYEAGDTPELPKAVANSAVDKGYAERTNEEVGEIEELGEKDEGEEVVTLDTGEDFDLDDWAGEKQDTQWLSANDENVEKGETMTVTSDEFEVVSFSDGGEYPVIDVELEGDEYKLRLNKKNARRLHDEWGSDAENWRGNTIEIALIEYYENFDSKGMILTPAEE